MNEEGYVHDVRLVALGGFLEGDHLAGVSTLQLMDASDFNAEGGSFILNGVTIVYTAADADIDTVTLSAPLASDALNGDRLEVYPQSVEKQAVVVVDGFDEAITAIVPHSLHDRLADGIREDFNRESVTVSLQNNIWFVENVFGIAPIIDGQYLENVVADDIIDGIVTEVKLANEAVTGAKIAANAVTETKIANDSVSTPKLIAGSVVADKLAADSVTAAKIVAGAVTTAKLDALAVTSDKIAANAITASKIDAGAITADKLDAAAITGKTITGGTITGALIRTAASGERIVIDSSTNTMSVFDVDGNNMVITEGTLVANDSDGDEILRLNNEGLKLYNHTGFGGGGTIEFVPDGYDAPGMVDFDAHGLGNFSRIGLRTGEYNSTDGMLWMDLLAYNPTQNTDPEFTVYSTQDREAVFTLNSRDQGRGVLSYVNSQANSGTATTTEMVHVTTPTIVFQPGRAYRITYHYQGQSTVGGDTLGFRIRKSNTSGNSLFDSLRSHKGTNANDIVNGESSQIIYNSSGSNVSSTIVGTVYRSLGTGTINGFANAANPVWLMVEDIGVSSDFPGIKAL
ncbi:hypothetical protein ABZ714_14400 [Streptomyces sp. NPDC006798]|uniref:hypothetical protein n=1 Tax=unclassified Streptomyces TaxID=2593676 RepID=UPI0033D9C8E7